MSTQASGYQKPWDRVLYGGTSTAGINAALANNDRVKIKGNQTLTDTVLLQDDNIIGLFGNLTAQDALNVDMIQNANQAGHNQNIHIFGPGVIDGNGANQTVTSRGIEIINATEPDALCFPTITIEGITVYDTFGTGIHVYLDGSGGTTLRLRNVSSYANRAGSGGELGHSLYWGLVYDSHIDGGFFSSNDTTAAALYLTSTSMCKVHPYYINNRVQVVLGNQIDFSAATTDLSRNNDMINILGHQYGSFHDITGRVYGDGDANTHNLIELAISGATNSIHNRFYNLIATRRGGAGTRTWHYVVEEVDANQDYNIYGLIDGSDCAAGAVRQLGVNGKPRANPKDDIIGTVVLV